MVKYKDLIKKLFMTIETVNGAKPNMIDFKQQEYAVQAGDTVYKIAQKCGIPKDKLAKFHSDLLSKYQQSPDYNKWGYQYKNELRLRLGENIPIGYLVEARNDCLINESEQEAKTVELNEISNKLEGLGYQVKGISIDKRILTASLILNGYEYPVEFIHDQSTQLYRLKSPDFSITDNSIPNVELVNSLINNRKEKLDFLTQKGYECSNLVAIYSNSEITYKGTIKIEEQNISFSFDAKNSFTIKYRNPQNQIVETTYVSRFPDKNTIIAKLESNGLIVNNPDNIV